MQLLSDNLNLRLGRSRSRDGEGAGSKRELAFHGLRVLRTFLVVLPKNLTLLGLIRLSFDRWLGAFQST